MTSTEKPVSDVIESSLSSLREKLESVTPEEMERRQARRDEQDGWDKQRRIMELRENWNAPRRHVEKTPERKGPWGDQLTKLESMLGSGFIAALTGIRGNGKTQLSVELMKTVTGQANSARFTTAMDFFMEIKATYKRDSDKTEHDILRRYSRPSLLVIDEVARRAESDWENNLLFELVNRRYNDTKDTLLVANLNPIEFQSCIGASIVSRLNETGGLINCDWPSFR